MLAELGGQRRKGGGGGGVPVGGALAVWLAGTGGLAGGDTLAPDGTREAVQRLPPGAKRLRPKSDVTGRWRQNSEEEGEEEEKGLFKANAVN